MPEVPHPSILARWLSDDRVNSLVRADMSALLEIGSHGIQPVNRNSRMLAGTDILRNCAGEFTQARKMT